MYLCKAIDLSSIFSNFRVLGDVLVYISCLFAANSVVLNLLCRLFIGRSASPECIGKADVACQ
jgi:hypothetical protein